MDQDNQSPTPQSKTAQDLTPSEAQPPLTARDEPGTTNKTFEVPQDVANAGQATNLPEPDSPESLDQDLSQGTNREDIDPQHSYDRPQDIDNKANVTNEDA